MPLSRTVCCWRLYYELAEKQADRREEHRIVLCWFDHHREKTTAAFAEFRWFLFFGSPRLYAIYHTPLLGLLQYSSLVFVFIHLYVQFCSYLCIILFCLLHVLILCIVYLCILCIRRSSLWLLYFNKRVCVISIKPSMRFLLRCGRQW